MRNEVGGSSQLHLGRPLYCRRQGGANGVGGRSLGGSTRRGAGADSSPAPPKSSRTKGPLRRLGPGARPSCGPPPWPAPLPRSLPRERPPRSPRRRCGRPHPFGAAPPSTWSVPAGAGASDCARVPKRRLGRRGAPVPAIDGYTIPRGREGSPSPGVGRGAHARLSADTIAGEVRSGGRAILCRLLVNERGRPIPARHPPGSLIVR